MLLSEPSRWLAEYTRDAGHVHGSCTPLLPLWCDSRIAGASRSLCQVTSAQPQPAASFTKEHLDIDLDIDSASTRGRIGHTLTASCLLKAVISTSSKVTPILCRSFLSMPFQFDHVSPGPLLKLRTSQGSGCCGMQCIKNRGN